MTARSYHHIPTLDGLRAVAILLVVCSHSIDHVANPTAVDIGHLGVLLFFALSGYLITRLLVHEFRASGAISLRDFYTRRAFRILPPAMFYLALMWTLNAVGVLVCDPSAIRSAAFFYTNYVDPVPQGWKVGHFWSLSVEEHFYVFWPCLLLLFGAKTGWRTAITLVLSIYIWRYADRHFELFDNSGSPFRTDLIADTLLWGCVLAFVPLRPSAPISTAITLAAGALYWAYGVSDVNPWLLAALPSDPDSVNAVKHFLPALILGAIVSAPSAPIGRLLELAPLKWLGRLSYSLYIWQQLFLRPGRVTVLTLAAPLLLAYLSYRFIEQPSIGLGRRLRPALARRRGGSAGTAEEPT